MNLFMTIIVGGIIGFVASRMMKTDAQMGIVANIVIGIVGSYLGGMIASVMGIGGGAIAGFVIAVAGAALLIGVLKQTGVLERIPV